jgi:SAM-dependent methyltransferase
LACGAGRHALYLARLGWSVTAVDSSAVAIDRLRTQAEGLPLDARQANLETGEFKIPPNTYHLVCDFYYLQRSLFALLRETLHPGGVFVGAIHLFDDAPGRNPNYLLHPGELRSFFDGWKVLYYSEGSQPRHSRKQARIIARRA